MGFSIWILVSYIATIVIWNSILKRHIGEAMLIGWIVTLLFSGNKMFQLMLESLRFSLSQETIFAAVAFIFMSHILNKTNILHHAIEILNSLLGRIAGGAGYIATLASALFGMISGSGSANAASVGSITIPWMISSNWSREVAATVVAGNAGLGIALGPSSSMFFLLSMAGISSRVSPSAAYLAVLTAGLWTLVFRLLLITYFIHKYEIKSLTEYSIMPLKESIGTGWPSLLIFIGVLIPIIVTVNPVAAFLKSVVSLGSNGVRSISIIVWIPIIVSWIALIVGKKHLPKTLRQWFQFVSDGSNKIGVVGSTLFFAFAAGYTMSSLGFAEELSLLLQRIQLPPVLMISMIGLLIVIVCGPLTSTASMATIGAVAFAALSQLEVAPAVAVATILIFSSTEGASPPNSAPIFIASSIAKINPPKIFLPLIIYYVLPILLIGVLIALGVLPIAKG